MALDLNRLVSAAAKAAVGAAEIGKEIIGGVVSGVKEGIASEAAERAAGEANSPEDARRADLAEKLPWLKGSEEKAAEVLAAHPEREKLWFRLPDSVTEGVIFRASDGREVYAVPEGGENLRKIVLCRGETPVGGIEKVITVNILSPAGQQKYAVSRSGEKLGILTVDGLDVKPDFASWTMKHIGLVNADFSFADEVGNEFARIYHLGNAGCALDYSEKADPAELILAFMAVIIRSGEIKRNHGFSRRGAESGLPLDGVRDVIAGIRDIF